MKRLALFLLLVAAASSERDQCTFGELCELDVSRSERGGKGTAIYGAVAEPYLGGPLPRGGLHGRTQLAQPADACSPLQARSEHDVAGGIILVVRGSCDFKSKALAVQEAGGAAMVLYDNVPGCVSMAGGDSTNTTHSQNVTIPCVSISHSDGLKLRKELEAMGVSAPGLTTNLHYTTASFDPASALLLCLAVLTVITGALWSGHDHQLERAFKASRRGTQGGAQRSRIASEDTLEIGQKAAICFVLLASALLVVLFYFIQFAFYLLLAMFCIASINAVAMLLEALIRSTRLLPASASDHVTHVPFFGPGHTLYLACCPVATCLTLVWLVWRESDYAWVLQDLQGIALMLLILRMLKLASIKVACILLPLCFFYDIFWVFISPLFFHGASVMVEVAKGGPKNESLPMLLRMPSLGKTSQLGGYSMLGYGDIVLPGLLIAFLRRFDIERGFTGWSLIRGYFLPASVGYVVGMSLCYAALYNSWFGNQGQPALLYLVPCTVGLVLLLATARRELVLLFEPKKDYRPVDSKDSDDDGATQTPSSAPADDGSAPLDVEGGVGSQPTQRS